MTNILFLDKFSRQTFGGKVCKKSAWKWTKIPEIRLPFTNIYRHSVCRNGFPVEIMAKPECVQIEHSAVEITDKMRNHPVD